MPDPRSFQFFGWASQRFGRLRDGPLARRIGCRRCSTLLHRQQEPPMQITQSLHRAVARQPGAVATICGGRRHTFEQFHDRVARLAGALQDLGVEKGDRVGILSLNSDRYVEYYMAVPWAGAATNPVNSRWSATEIGYSLDDCDTKVLLIDDPLLPLLPELRRLSKSLRTLIHVGDGPTPEGLLSYEALIADTMPV